MPTEECLMCISTLKRCFCRFLIVFKHPLLEEFDDRARYLSPFSLLGNNQKSLGLLSRRNPSSILQQTQIRRVGLRVFPLKVTLAHKIDDVST